MKDKITITITETDGDGLMTVDWGPAGPPASDDPDDMTVTQWLCVSIIDYVEYMREMVDEDGKTGKDASGAGGDA